jgi:hypothetical protein
MKIEDIENLKKAYPILSKQIEVIFPTNSVSGMNKVLNLLENEPRVKKFIKDLLVSNTNNKKEDRPYMIINNVNDLKKAYPELVNELISDALAEERNYNLEKNNKIRESIAAENNLINIAVESVNKGRRR